MPWDTQRLLLVLRLKYQDKLLIHSHKHVAKLYNHPKPLSFIMDQFSSPSTIASITVLVLTILFTAPTIFRIYARVGSRSKVNGYDDVHKLYEDEDGAATEETQKEFSVALPTYLALSSALIGCLASITNAVITTVPPIDSLGVESWIILGNWVCEVLSLCARFMLINWQSLLVVIMMAIATEHKSTTRFDHGILSATSSIAILITLCVRCWIFLSDTNDVKVYDILVAVQVVAAILCCVSSLLLPRRPFIVDADQLVDGQYTVSALGRYTFSWAGRILAVARHKKTLDFEDLSKLHLRARSAHLQKDFESRRKRDHLWKGLIVAHYAEILFQSFFAVAQSAAQFVPQISMYLLLTTIERRPKGTPTSKTAWVFVVTLGLSIIFASWGQAWAHFIGYARLGQPVRTELSAMIFVKATRRKDVKDVQRSKNPAALSDSYAAIPAEPHSPTPQTAIEQNSETGLGPALTHDVLTPNSAEEDIQKTRQSTINLVVSFPLSLQMLHY